MIEQADAETAVEGVRALVAADGGDVLVAETGDDFVRLTLVLETAECAECVMPRQFLETVALDMMKPTLSALTRVDIDDPREESASR